MIEIINENNKKLSKLCLNQKGMTFGKFMSLLKKKNIKVNGLKTNKDIMVNVGDNITIYGFETLNKNPIK
ncbi:MAG: hypothetical protein IJW82_01875, partial [Clostridia bacterium]|nr:hypothetical protein [Clostridia bacterium]